MNHLNDFRKVEADLRRDEGSRLKPYTDTAGKLTIGVGHNLTDKGISERVEAILLHDDIQDAVADLNRNVPWWSDLPSPALRGLLNMCFNLGWPRLSRFKRMLAALKEERFEDAAREALKSKWAEQVGKRAERIAGLYRICSLQDKP